MKRRLEVVEFDRCQHQLAEVRSQRIIRVMVLELCNVQTEMSTQNVVRFSLQSDFVILKNNNNKSFMAV